MTDSGLLCPKCNGGTYVYNSRPKSNGTTKRYRECLHCGFRFKTIEIVETDEMKAEKIKNEDYRAKDMLKLRESGMTYEEIGKQFGVSKQRVYQILSDRRIDNAR